jgi:sporulation protein YlmC with PRC-barrel domain
MAGQAQTAAVVRLGDTDKKVEHQEDVRGRKVVDRHGEEIGKVDELMVDEREFKVRFLEVASGGLLGLGATKVLIPVDAIERLEPNVVRINQTRETVAGAPRYDPDIKDQKYYGDVYGYYGYSPWWGAGYVYPRHPRSNF